MPSLQAEQMPSITHGKCADQSFPAARARKASLRRRWNLSTNSLDCGWYAVVGMWVMFRSLQRAAQSANVN